MSPLRPVLYPVLSPVIQGVDGGIGDAAIPDPGFMWLYDDEGRPVFDDEGRRVQTPIES